jgi:hypothetical protein
LEQGVELGEGFAVLGPQGIRCVQDDRNPFSFGFTPGFILCSVTVLSMLFYWGAQVPISTTPEALKTLIQ